MTARTPDLPPRVGRLQPGDCARCGARRELKPLDIRGICAFCGEYGRVSDETLAEEDDDE